VITIQKLSNGKKCLYFNRYDSVYEKVCQRLREPLSDLAGDHLYPLISFFQFLESHGCVIRYHKCIHELHLTNVHAIASHDLSLSAIKALGIVRLRCPSVYSALLLSEHPFYQSKLFNPSILNLFTDVYTSMDINCAAKRPIISPYIFRQIPSLDQPQSIPHGQVYDTVIISSNLPSRPGMTYANRRHLINILSEIDLLSFSFYGRGWRLSNYLSNPRFYAKYAVANLSHSTKLTARALSKYRGEVYDKAILFNSKSCISIENSLLPLGYITEKYIEPLVYGAVPVYMGSFRSSELFEVLPPSTRRFFGNDDVTALLQSCLEFSDMSHAESRAYASSIRSSINRYLSDNSFSTGLWMLSEQILHHLS
jgi:hypothetical protein